MLSLDRDRQGETVDAAGTGVLRGDGDNASSGKARTAHAAEGCGQVHKGGRAAIVPTERSARSGEGVREGGAQVEPVGGAWPQVEPGQRLSKLPHCGKAINEGHKCIDASLDVLCRLVGCRRRRWSRHDGRQTEDEQRHAEHHRHQTSETPTHRRPPSVKPRGLDPRSERPVRDDDFRNIERATPNRNGHDFCCQNRYTKDSDSRSEEDDEQQSNLKLGLTVVLWN